MKNCSIKNEYYTITVSTLGAELISVKNSDGAEYLWQNTGSFWDSHAPLLFPVCGRLKSSKYSYQGKEYPMDLHGFIKDSEFAVASKEGGHITMTLSSNAKTREIYPFDFNVIANYELRGKEIIFSVKITNTGKGELPYMFGWHPGFKLPTGDSLDINCYSLNFGEGVTELDWYPLQNGAFARPYSEKYPLKNNEYQLSEEEIYKNDTMIFEGHKNKLTLSAKGAPYSLDMSWTQNLPYLCVWKDEFNEAKYICLEPWSAIPNDGVTDENFDTRKMNRLAAGESETYSYTLNFNA